MNNTNKLDLLINSIYNHKENYSLIDIFSEYSFMELEDLVNYYLERIKTNCKNKDINSLSIKSNDISKYFDYNFNIFDESIKKENFSIIEEAEIISDDLIHKVLGRNNRYISLPIKLEDISKYSISNYISDININKVYYWIILKLAIINYLS